MLKRISEAFKQETIVPVEYTNELRQSYLSTSVTSRNLNGKTVIITGANGGIGTALCLRFAKEGCNVLFTVRTEQKKEYVINNLRKEFSEGNYKGFVLDICDTVSINSFVRTISKYKIDILINNAGVFTNVDKKRAFRAVTKKEFCDVLNTNLIGMIELTQHIIPQMPETGSIINISSICSLYSRYQYTPYGISKSGVTSYTKKLREKYPKMNIHAIAPGSIATNMADKKLGSNLSYKSNYLKRIILPEEISALCAFLSSQYGEKITNIPVLASAGEIF